MSEVQFECLNSETEISVLLKEFAPFFHNQKINNENAIALLSQKFCANGIVMRASIEGISVGFCAFYSNDFVNLCAYLSMIVVAPSFQGMGIGRLLLTNMIDVCRSKGMKLLRLEVADDNDKAISLYERNNFHKEKKLTQETSLYVLEL